MAMGGYGQGGVPQGPPLDISGGDSNGLYCYSHAYPLNACCYSYTYPLNNNTHTLSLAIILLLLLLINTALQLLPLALIAVAHTPSHHCYSHTLLILLLTQPYFYSNSTLLHPTIIIHNIKITGGGNNLRGGGIHDSGGHDNGYGGANGNSAGPNYRNNHGGGNNANHQQGTYLRTLPPSPSDPPNPHNRTHTHHTLFILPLTLTFSLWLLTHYL